MAGFGGLLQRIAHSLEEASAQQPGDQLRERLGYGSADDDEYDPATDAEWEREIEPETESAWTPESDGEPKSIWKPAASRAPKQAAVAQRKPEPYRAAGRAAVSASGATAPSSRRTSPSLLLAQRIRARLHSPNVLRESFAIKEILDRPLARRRRT